MGLKRQRRDPLKFKAQADENTARPYPLQRPVIEPLAVAEAMAGMVEGDARQHQKVNFGNGHNSPPRGLKNAEAPMSKLPAIGDFDKLERLPLDPRITNTLGSAAGCGKKLFSKDFIVDGAVERQGLRLLKHSAADHLLLNLAAPQQTGINRQMASMRQ